MKKKIIEQKKAQIMRKLNQPNLTTQEKDRLSDEYRKLINKSIRQKM